MGNSKTSRYADGKTIYDLNHATAAWLRSLADRTRFQLADPQNSQLNPPRRRARPQRLDTVRRALQRAPAPQPVSARRGAGEIQRVLLDPQIAPRLRRLARRRRQDEGDVASVWAHVRVQPPLHSHQLPSEAQTA